MSQLHALKVYLRHNQVVLTISFTCKTKWIYFCLEYMLLLCFIPFNRSVWLTRLCNENRSNVVQRPFEEQEEKERTRRRREDDDLLKKWVWNLYSIKFDFTIAVKHHNVACWKLNVFHHSFVIFNQSVSCWIFLRTQ